MVRVTPFFDSRCRVVGKDGDGGCGRRDMTCRRRTERSNERAKRCGEEGGELSGRHSVHAVIMCVRMCFARAMSQGVKGHQVNERKAKIREQKRDEELRRYHNDILAAPEETATSDVTLPPIQNLDAVKHHVANVYISRHITM